MHDVATPNYSTNPIGAGAYDVTITDADGAVRTM